MNWIELLNRFYDLLQCNHVSNNAQLLYYTLLQINNRCSWMEWFQRTNVSLSNLMDISEKALIRARNELKQLGLIDFVSGKRRGDCTKYLILACKKDSLSDSLNDRQSDRQSDRLTAVQTTDIIKHKQKQKETPIIPFCDFWLLYPRKTAKAKAEQAYNKINPDTELFEIMRKSIERQKQSVDWKKDNGQYIPHASTWLNGRRWEDETVITNTRKKARESEWEQLD